MPKDRYEDHELDGRYHLLRLLDEGNFGAVYEARDSKLGRTVAVKILFEKDETAFRKEAKLAVQFEHPNVVKVFDYGADQKLNVGYIVMEFLKGRRLDQLITSYRGRLPDALIVRFVDQIGAALQLAHERQLIHRDLKPHNVMMVDENTPQERFVLLDLGLASQMNSTSTLRNQTLDGALSPRYASPEQFGQGSVDFRSDIYSFGTILYELVTGETPFVREQLLSLMMAICSEPSPSFRDTAPDREVPPEVEDIVQHCLAKQPKSRPDSIRIVRSRILAAFGADTAMPSMRRHPVTITDTDHAGTTMPSGVPRHTGTMLPPAKNTPAEELQQIPSKGSVAKPVGGRSRKRRQQSASWQPVIIALTILIPALFIAWHNLGPRSTTGPSKEPTILKVGRMVVPAEVVVNAGKTAMLQVFVEPPEGPDGDQSELVLETSDIPPALTVKIPEPLPRTELIELSMTADLVTESYRGEFSLTATRGNWSETKVVRLHIVAPEVWTLPENFEPAPGTEIVRSVQDGRLFYRQIVRVVAPDIRVSLLLIDPLVNSSGGSKTISPFYVMEQKVWNQLFEQYWGTVESSDLNSEPDSEWKLGASAGGRNLEATMHPRLPVVRITASQAHRFAVWFGGVQSCHLPSIDQWNLAAGLKQWLAMSPEQQAEFPEGPYRGMWKAGATDVSVDRRQAGPRSVGESLDDVTLTGCTDMAGNVQELTENLLNGARVGDLDLQTADGALLRVVLRGRHYQSETPLRWDDIRELPEIPDAIGYNETDPTIGFRVVLETTR